MNWVEKQLDGAYFTEVHRIGLPEIALATALDWMIFRESYPVRNHRELMRFLETHGQFAPFVNTRPGK